MPCRLPPFLPLARAASKPNFVRSRIKSLSNSANEAEILKNNLPCGVMLSIASLMLLITTSFVLNSANTSYKCFRERPKRSS